jgi:hypothetical protein
MFQNGILTHWFLTYHISAIICSTMLSNSAVIVKDRLGELSELSQFISSNWDSIQCSERIKAIEPLLQLLTSRGVLSFQDCSGASEEVWVGIPVSIKRFLMEEAKARLHVCTL